MTNFSDPVPELRLGLQNFRSMSRIKAERRKASALWLRHSQSLARRLRRLSQPMVRSTTQLLDSNLMPDLANDDSSKSRASGGWGHWPQTPFLRDSRGQSLQGICEKNGVWGQWPQPPEAISLLRRNFSSVEIWTFWYQRRRNRPIRIRHITGVAQLAAVVPSTVVHHPHQSSPTHRPTLSESQKAKPLQDVPRQALPAEILPCPVAALPFRPTSR